MKRRWLAPEVVQTSAMDCGPAALKCVLEGLHIAVSYGRLREACQTDVDGTSIDTLEVVARQLGLAAEQVMIPLDHVFLPQAATLPAVAVVRQADGATHFVVVWRRLGGWLQVMDPAHGRRWVRWRTWAAEIFRHELSVPEADWRVWAASDDGRLPLRQRVQLLGAERAAAAALLAAAAADPGWFAYAALDASVRLVHSPVQAGGVTRGGTAARLVRSLFEQSCGNTEDIFKIVPQAYWSVVPDVQSEAHAAAPVPAAMQAPTAAQGQAQQQAEMQMQVQMQTPLPLPFLQLRLRGAVLLRAGAAAAAGQPFGSHPTPEREPDPLPPCRLNWLPHCTKSRPIRRARCSACCARTACSGRWH